MFWFQNYCKLYFLRILKWTTIKFLYSMPITLNIMTNRLRIMIYLTATHICRKVILSDMWINFWASSLQKEAKRLSKSYQTLRTKDVHWMWSNLKEIFRQANKMKISLNWLLLKILFILCSTISKNTWLFSLDPF